jgi:dodecin
MPDHIYQTVEITGSSSSGIQAAIENAIRHAAAQHAGLRWFEVTETRGHIEKGVVAHWQVSLKIGLTLPPAKSADSDRPA